MEEKKKKGIFNIFTYIFGVIAILFTIYTMYSIHKFNLFNFHNISNYIYIMGIIDIIIIIVCMLKLKKTAIVISILTIILNSVAFYGIQSVTGLFEKFNQNAKYEEIRVNIYTLKENEKTDISSIISDIEKGKDLIIMGSKNDEETAKKTKNKLVEDIVYKNNKLSKEKVDEKLKIEYKNTYVETYKDIIDKKQEMMILNSAYEGILELNDEKYKDKIKSIYETDFKEEIKELKKENETNQENQNNHQENKHISKKDGVYNIYISGIDVAGNIATVSRSDVNIIMTVNTKTKKILLTTTPRDTYLKIPGKGQNQYDKLTHAGMYGIQTSIATLQDLYDMDIDYYVRLNFTSFINIINLVGNIQVYNDQEFRAYHGGYHMPKGMITLDAKKALSFVRERHHLENGDYDRGKNQEKVIEAVIKKIANIGNITKINTILDGIANSIQTNVKMDEVMKLVNKALEEKDGYEIKSQALEVKERLDLVSFALGKKIHMGEVQKDSLNKVRNKIIETMGN